MSRRGSFASFLLVVGVAALLTGCSNPYLRQQGINALEVNDIPRAETNFAKAVKQDDTDWRAMYYLGLVRNRQHRPSEAKVILERALTLAPSRPETTDILDELAESIYQQNEPPLLSAMLQKACEDYGTPRDYMRQGKYLGKIGDPDGAKVAFRKAIRRSNFKDPEPFLALADYLESVGDTEGTILNLRYAYYLLPNSGRIMERFRQYGLVPGPTLKLEPKPDIE
ncbi:MAG: hypothetical protein K8S99_12855 [Planctomycetes bacterium]|nr:hypothetical protein [Planctomycetota bacterium]